MIRSMTAFASRRGHHAGTGWEWDLRSVNGRGLEVRIRLPDGLEAVEPAVRAAVIARFARGSVGLSLKLERTGGEAGLSLDEVQLDRVLVALARVQDRAAALGLTLAPTQAADVMGQRGVLVGRTAVGADPDLSGRVLDDLDALLADALAARDAEGEALAAIVAGQLEAIAALVAAAAEAAEARRAAAPGELREAVARLAAVASPLDESRLAQELALLATKGDVTEEVDRLRAHVDAARALLAGDEPAGRRLDFLLQEFNREANTLMSKGGSIRLTRVGLDLKAVIDQMREQIQNVE